MADEKGGNPGSTGSQGAGAGVPEVFQKFVDPSTGSVDISKAADAYRQAEQKVSTTAQEKLELQRAYDEVSRRFTPSNAPRADAGVETGRKLTVEELLTDPEGTLDKVVDAKMAKAGRPIVDRLVEREHPEVSRKTDGSWKDPEFVDGLNRFARTLPPSIQQSLTAGDYDATMWTINQYKEAKKGAASMTTNTEKGTPFTESGKAPSTSEGGVKYKRSEIRKMARDNPKEYASKADDIAKAYEEGRVIID